MTHPHVELCRQVFANWSSSDADSNAALFHDDAVLEDIVAGTHHGWPAIREFFARGIVSWPDLAFEMHDYWVSDRGVACSWTMTATAPDDRLGAGTAGKRWAAPGMSYLVIEDGRVRHEADHWNRDSIVRTLA